MLIRPEPIFRQIGLGSLWVNRITCGVIVVSASTTVPKACRLGRRFRAAL
jgi:hypothetical protein